MLISRRDEKSIGWKWCMLPCHHVWTFSESPGWPLSLFGFKVQRFASTLCVRFVSTLATPTNLVMPHLPPETMHQASAAAQAVHRQSVPCRALQAADDQKIGICSRVGVWPEHIWVFKVPAASKKYTVLYIEDFWSQSRQPGQDLHSRCLPISQQLQPANA